MGHVVEIRGLVWRGFGKLRCVDLAAKLMAAVKLVAGRKNETVFMP